MPLGALIAGRANFFTLLKMVVPLLYARLYAYGRQWPYIFAAGLIAAGQVTVFAVAPQLRKIAVQMELPKKT